MLLEQLAKNTPLPSSRWHIATPSELADLGDALVFVHASWSGPSVRRWRIVGEAILPLPVLSVVVLDTDTPAPRVAEILHREPYVRGGAGALLWVRDGGVASAWRASGPLVEVTEMRAWITSLPR